MEYPGMQFQPAFGSPMPPDVFYGGGSKEVTNLNQYQINDLTYYDLLYDLMGEYMSVFEWRDLPEGCDERMLEWWMMFNGFCGLVYDPMLKESEQAPEGYAVMQLMLQGQMDIYQLPEEVSAYSVSPRFPLLQPDPENVVLMFDSMMRISPFPFLGLSASRMADIQRTIDVNVAQQKMPKVARANEKQKLTIENAINQVQGNQFVVWCDKQVDMSGVEVLDTSAPFVSDKLMTLYRQTRSKALTRLGIENNSSEKKERQVAGEVASNQADVEVHRFQRLVPRQQAAAKINAMLERNGYQGPEVKVNFRGGVYVSVDDPEVEEILDELENAGVDVAGGDGPSDGGVLKAAVRRIREIMGGGAE